MVKCFNMDGRQPLVNRNSDIVRNNNVYLMETAVARGSHIFLQLV